MTITLILNGKPFQLDGEPRIETLLTQTATEGRFVVALNGELLPRTCYATTFLQANDQIDILFPIAGG
ncbi:MAG: sulfur carrier protein ThiS [Hahellaceae bacterium]|nr:sulfur carrier protein ThiS [Hahellaceae bacterium]